METLKGGQVGDYARKLVLCAHGFAGEGKTTLLLTFPPPLTIVNCGDRDIKYLLEKLPEHYDINYEWIPFDVDAISKTTAEGFLSRAENALKVALKAGGSFLVDAADLLWEITQAAKVDSSGTALRFKAANEWGFSFWGRATKAANLQVGMTSMAAEIWEGPSSTGRYKHGGWKHLDRYIETDVRMFHKEQMVAGNKPVAVSNPTVTHAGYFEASKKNEILLRRIIENPSFATIYKMTYGQAHPQEELLWRPT